MPDRDFDLGQQIAELRGLVIEGFRGVHARQDTTNGRIGKVEARVDDLERLQDTSDGRAHGSRATWQAILTVVSLIIAALAIYYH